MNFHVYIEDALQQALAEYCKATGKKRNAVVREALGDYLVRKPADPRDSLSDFIANYVPDEGALSMPPFESYRDELLPPREDIF